MFTYSPAVKRQKEGLTYLARLLPRVQAVLTSLNVLITGLLTHIWDVYSSSGFERRIA
jgi:hypothetical protein